MATQTAPARALTARRRPRGRPVPGRGLPRRRLAGGVVWIAVVAALLAGVVALNVVVLRLNMRLDELGTERVRLRSEIAELKSRAADESTPAHIRAQLYANGYRPAAAGSIRFVTLDPQAR
jgi:hypothetical protein